MKYEVFDIEPIENVFERIVNIMVDENSAVNFPADMENESYLKFLSEQNLTDKKIQAMKPNVWHDMIQVVPEQPVAEEPAVEEPVVEETENGTE
jgi:hypothetical protein